MTKILCGFVAASLLYSVVKPTLGADATGLPQTMTLQDCLDLAIKQNPSILKAQQEIRRTQSQDHPILLTVPETHYLKCLILEAI